MDLKELEQTDVWTLYDKAVSYMRMFNTFTDTDRNYRMYNGDQWEGLNLDGIEKVQLNFIKPIIDYKVAVINQNLWGIVYNNQNFEDNNFKQTADQICKLLNKKAS